MKFLRVEDWAKKVKRERDIDNDSYLKEVFTTIENGVREQLKKQDSIVFESTGLTAYFDAMLSSLQQDFNLVTIGIHADLELCVKRVSERDQSIHIPFSEQEVKDINLQVKEKHIDTDHIINNENKTLDSLKSELRAILDQRN